jgi:hypothetical protein
MLYRSSPDGTSFPIKEGCQADGLFLQQERHSQVTKGQSGSHQPLG